MDTRKSDSFVEDAITLSDRANGRFALPTKAPGQHVGPVRWDGMDRAFVTRLVETKVLPMRVVGHKRQQVTLGPTEEALSARVYAKSVGGPHEGPVYFREGEQVYVTQAHGRVVRMRAVKVRGERVTLAPCADKE